MLRILLQLDADKGWFAAPQTRPLGAQHRLVWTPSLGLFGNLHVPNISRSKIFASSKDFYCGSGKLFDRICFRAANILF